MIVESIYAIADTVGQRQRVRHVTNLVDNQGRKYIETAQYFYTLYNNKGTLEVEKAKGTNIDHTG
jgi:hypothetical protein